MTITAESRGLWDGVWANNLANEGPFCGVAEVARAIYRGQCGYQGDWTNTAEVHQEAQDDL